jgi:putative ABC transport system permease protein
MTAARYVESLFYGVKATDPVMMAIPAAATALAAVIAPAPAMFYALRIDPVAMLRSE